MCEEDKKNNMQTFTLVGTVPKAERINSDTLKERKNKIEQNKEEQNKKE